MGGQIAAVELKDLDIPENMQRAIAKEAEAIREKRARIVKADAELEAANKPNEAAAIIAPHPAALELRRLQALTEIDVEHNSVIIVSLPVENNATAMSAAFTKSIADSNVAPLEENAPFGCRRIAILLRELGSTHQAVREPGGRESCADFRVGVWDFKPKPE